MELEGENDPRTFHSNGRKGRGFGVRLAETRPQDGIPKLLIDTTYWVLREFRQQVEISVRLYGAL